MGRHDHDACRLTQSELLIYVDGAFACIQPAERPFGLVRSQSGGSGGVHRRTRNADQRGLHDKWLRQLLEGPLLDDANNEMRDAGRQVRALLPLGVGLYYIGDTDYVGPRLVHDSDPRSIMRAQPDPNYLITVSNKHVLALESAYFARPT